jgi:hypothetical protein
MEFPIGQIESVVMLDLRELPGVVGHALHDIVDLGAKALDPEHRLHTSPAHR